MAEELNRVVHSGGEMVKLGVELNSVVHTQLGWLTCSVVELD